MTPTRPSPTRRARSPQRPTTPPWSRSATRGEPKGLRSSRGSRARCTTTTSSTSRLPRAAGRRRTGLRRRQRADGFGRGNGQVWAYHTRSQTLQLLYQAPVDDVEANLTFDFPDNITTSRRGTLVVCEDSTVDNYIRGLSRGGQLWDIALNRLVSQLTGNPRFGDEFAGSTFSRDGHTLFVNIQASRGMSFAIWGPWERIGV